MMARSIYVVNDAGELVVGLGKNDAGDGLATTMSAKGTALVGLNATAEGQEGTVTTYQLNGKPLVAIGSTEVGHEGMVRGWRDVGREAEGDTGGTNAVQSLCSGRKEAKGG